MVIWPLGGARMSCARARLFVALLMPVLAAALVQAAVPPHALAAGATTPQLAAQGARGVSFEINNGQTDSSVKFLARGAQYPLFLTANQAVFELLDTATLADPSKATSPVKGDVVRLQADGANTSVQVTGLDPVPGITNYLTGKDPRKWQQGIKSYQRVLYSGIYPGIDLVYYGAPDGAVEYDYVVSPGADASTIVTDVQGADQASVDRNGDLTISTAVGTLSEHRPTIYQNVNGKKKLVSGGYQSLGGNRVGFSVGAHDRSQPIVIDPLLSYSTFLGGNIGQSLGSPGNSIAVDSSGDAYVTGSTFAPDFPTTTGAFQTAKFGDPTSSNFPNTTNAFVTKLSPDGSSLVYSTYLGGTGKGFFAGDIGWGIAVDTSGRAFVTGSTTSDDFPITGNAFQANRTTTCTTCFNAFLTELDAHGSSLMYSTYLGGSSGNGGNQEGGRSVALDAAGHAYVAGIARSFDFPTTSSALQRVCPSECANNNDGVSTSGSPNYTSAAAFFTASDAGSPISGTNIPANSVIGTVVDATTITLGDGNGNAVDATSTGSGLAFTIGGRTRVQAGFFARFDPGASGSASLTYSTLLGGGSGQEVPNVGGDAASGVAVDAAGEAYVTGRAASYDFPTTPGAFQTVCNECPILVDGATQAGSTVFTSASAHFGPFDRGDAIQGIDIPEGTTIASVDSPTQVTLDTPAEATGTGLKYTYGPTVFRSSRATTAFVLKLDPGASGPASLVVGTFLGGAGGVDAGTALPTGTTGSGIAVDPSRRTIYVAGTTDSFDFPTTPGAVSRTCDGSPPCGAFATFNDGVTTSGSTTLTSATANFQQGSVVQDQGANIAGANIAPGTTIAAVVNPTTVTLSQAATGSGTAAFELETTNGAISIGASDQFVTELDPSGASLTYSTFLGGSGPQVGSGVAIDGAGDAYVVGNTSTPTFPLKDPVAPWGGGRPPDPTQSWNGADDVTVSEIAPNGKSLVYSTTLGGNNLDEPAGIAVDTSGAAYVTGSTKSPTFPTTPGSFKPVYGGRLNAFVAKISPVSATLPYVTGLSITHGPTAGGTTVVITGHGFSGAAAVTFGAVPASSFNVDSPTQITATSPPQAAATGPVDIAITTPAGNSPANPIARFDEGDGQWTAAQPLSADRDGPSATLLKNGKILVVGGNAEGVAGYRNISSAEVFDPVAGTWSPTAAPNSSRGWGHLATLLADGRVLVTGGGVNSGLPASSEIYDPGTGLWTTVAPPHADHSDGAATLLADGRVLVVGGFSNKTAEVYDPAANTWTALPTPVSSVFSLSGPSLTRLNNGQVLLAGGCCGSGSIATASAELFNPSTDTWSSTGSMNVSHFAAASTLLPDGRVLVAGGMQSSGDVPPVAAEEIYDPASGTWTLSGLLRQPREGATATLLPNGQVLIAGGLLGAADNGAGPLDSAELFDPSAPATNGIADNLITPRGMFTNHFATPTFRAVLLSSDTGSFQADPAVCGTNCGKVLVIGGSYDNSAELYSPAPNVTGASSAQQYSLDGSDGTTWQPIDTTKLSTTVTPAVNNTAVMVGNADLWTSAAGFNQDLGIQVTPQGGSPQLIAWKESGGNGGTFSPNAAAVQGLVNMTAGTTYTVQLVWKTNKSMPTGDQIFAGAGGPGNFSPTTLTISLYPSSGTAVHQATSTQQFMLNGSNGTTWQTQDSGGHTLPSWTVTPATTTDALLSGNADLWTETAGFNQDLGISVTPACGGQPGELTAWKESGGSAGTFSPNAAYVQAVCPMTGGTQYAVQLVWKANQSMPSGDKIAAGAGSPGNFSPTSLFGVLEPSANVTSAVSTQQYMQTSDGSTWQHMDDAVFNPQVTPPGSCAAVITGNADLWTDTSGYNQDLGIMVNGTVIAWKESGGFAGTFSPNAAYVQALYPVTTTTPFTVTLVWKSNTAMASGTHITIGAGPLPAGSTTFSPTSLTVDLRC